MPTNTFPVIPRSAARFFRLGGRRGTTRSGFRTPVECLALPQPENLSFFPAGTSPSSPLVRTAGTASYPAALARPAERPGTSQRTRSHPEPRTNGRRNTVQRRRAITAMVRRRHIRPQPETTSVTLWIDALDRPAWQILHAPPFFGDAEHRSPRIKCVDFAASCLWCQAKSYYILWICCSANRAPLRAQAKRVFVAPPFRVALLESADARSRRVARLPIPAPTQAPWRHDRRGQWRASRSGVQDSTVAP
jgi:hypothetical protein